MYADPPPSVCVLEKLEPLGLHVVRLSPLEVWHVVVEDDAL
jgi:hypothetical protein